MYFTTYPSALFSKFREVWGVGLTLLAFRRGYYVRSILRMSSSRGTDEQIRVWVAFWQQEVYRNRCPGMTSEVQRQAFGGSPWSIGSPGRLNSKVYHSTLRDSLHQITCCDDRTQEPLVWTGTTAYLEARSMMLLFPET